METLEVIIGLVFIYLLLSLLATTIQEIVASVMSMRGQVLLKAIAKLLEIENLDEFANSSKKKAYKAFKKKIRASKIYRKYSNTFLGITQYPSYLSSQQVADIIKEIMKGDEPQDGEVIATRGLDDLGTQSSMLDGMKQNGLKKHLEAICYEDEEPQYQTRGLAEAIDNVEETVDKAKESFKHYYEETMDRATGWYKRGVQRNLFIIGLILGLAFDADTFKIYSNLNKYPDDRKELLALAQGFTSEDRLQAYASPADSIADLERVNALKTIVDSLLISEIKTVPAPLGLGRTGDFPAAPPAGVNPIFWRITKFFGWIVTALAVSMGAAFWFDLLKRLIHIRNAGVRPEDADKQRAS